MYAFLAILLFSWLPEANSLHVQHKIDVRSNVTPASTTTTAPAATASSKTDDSDDKSPTLAYIALGLGGALTLGAVGFYFAKGVGLYTIGLGLAGVASTGLGVYMYINHKSAKEEPKPASS
jgi:uncharacterized protein HemX